jgi:hypothetical protein
MIIKFKNNPSKAIAIFLIVIVGIFSINEYLYIHKHISNNGEIIIHAHPYDKSKDTGQNKSHKHETGDLVYLASLQTFLPAVVFVFIAHVTYLEHTYTEKALIFKAQHIFLFTQERGPPFVF